MLSSCSERRPDAGFLVVQARLRYHVSTFHGLVHLDPAGWYDYRDVGARSDAEESRKSRNVSESGSREEKEMNATGSGSVGSCDWNNHMCILYVPIHVSRRSSQANKRQDLVV